MSMYDLMTGGPHPLAGLWLDLLDIDPGEVARLRNAYIVFEQDEPRIYLLTRESDNPLLSEHEQHVRNGPCGNDSTYWEFEFELPEYLKPEIAEIAGIKEIVSLPKFEEHFGQMMDRLKNGDKGDPITKGMLDRAKPVLTRLAEKIESGEGGIIEV